MNQKVLVESLAMDLKRAALGFYRGSTKMGDRFRKEALKRSNELENQAINSYLRTLIKKTKIALNNQNKIAEDALMYSTLFQNFALKKM